MNNNIDILLATYNGELFLKEQIDSILSQTNTSWKLIIRDDGSTDGTPSIIREYVQQHSGKIFLINDDEHLGSCLSFSRLLEHATSDYIMFCDQDDVWLPHKIEMTFNKMKQMESANSKDTPLMVHTDLVVVNDILETISYSFWKCQSLDHTRGNDLNRLMIQNVATGCTMMINRSLQKIATPISTEAIMHDWWFTLVSAAFGKNGAVTEPTVLYRQHANNAIGAKNWSLFEDIIMLTSSQKRAQTKIKSQLLLKTYRNQAKGFLDIYCEKLTSNSYTMINVFVNLDKFNAFKRKYFIIKYRFFYNNPIITAAMILFRW